MNSTWWKHPWPHGAKPEAAKTEPTAKTPKKVSWWDSSSDEALFWPEEAHAARARRMEQIERSLEQLRGIRRRPRYDS